jgi:hypothetical protein
MTRLHMAVEILFETLYQPACENAAGRDAFTGRPVEMTDDETQVTCKRCLKAIGIEATEPEMLTVVEGDPLRRAA